MTSYKVDAHVFYKDAAERETEATYRLRLRYDSTLNTGAGNMNAVLTTVETLLTNLQVLTWCELIRTEVCLVLGSDLSAANFAANNQVHALTYVRRADSKIDTFDVPGWDDLTYDQDEFNLLSPAYNAAAQAVADLLESEENADAFVTVLRSVSRTHKSRGKKIS